MKPKAIVSFLWSRQFHALSKFLATHEPMTVITYHYDDELKKIVSDNNSNLKSLDSEITDDSHEVNVLLLQEIKEKFSKLSYLIDSLEIAREKYDIGLVLVNEDYTNIGRTAALWAKNHNIPSLHLAHSVNLCDLYTVYNKIVADKIAVYGERGVDAYVDANLDISRLVKTGNPAWDIYATLKNKKVECRQFLVEKYNLNNALPIITFATTWSAGQTAQDSPAAFQDTLVSFFIACEALRSHNILANIIIKDRPSNSSFGLAMSKKIITELGFENLTYIHTFSDTEIFAAGSDVIIAVNSNYIIESMLADTPAINLINDSCLLHVMSAFDATSGVKEVEADDLAKTIFEILNDPVLRDEQIRQQRNSVGHYQEGGNDGNSSNRVTNLMTEMVKNRIQKQYVWQKYLDNENAGYMGEYHSTGRNELINLFSSPRKIVLDIGCGSGGNGNLVKQKFKDCTVWGIESNKVAANMARNYYDHVLIGQFEDFDLNDEGILDNSLDGVILADVLEHMYNPWKVMQSLHKYISQDCELIISIPNVRNLWLMENLANGSWSYDKEGLLDITHIRFFTCKEFERLCHETGYKVISKQYSLDGRLSHIINDNNLTFPFSINTGKMNLKDISKEELFELCSLQFYFVLKKQDTMFNN